MRPSGRRWRKTIGATWSTPAKLRPALTHDPLLGGHIRRNLFNERLTIEATLPWVRESSVISDTDLAFLQLHLERHYGLKAERCLPGALKIAALEG